MAHRFKDESRALSAAPITNSYYDYTRQAWVLNGVYVTCGHTTACNCYGKAHAGEPADLTLRECSGHAPGEKCGTV